MSVFLQFAVLGLGSGAAYALLGEGVVLIYKGSGVLNFAQGAMALVSASIFYQLADVAKWGFWPAFLIAVATGGVLGLITFQLLMRPLRRAPALSRVLATLGVLVSLQAAIVLIWGDVPLLVKGFLPTSVFHVGSIVVAKYQVILTGIAVALTAALWLAFRFTRLGLSIRASAENSRAASALGWSPNVLGTVSWVAGSVLAGVAGVMIAPYTGIQTTQMTLTVIVAMAAALLGGFESFPLTCLGAFAIGIGESELGNYVHVEGFPTALSLLVIVIVLVVRGRGLPVRGFVGERFAEVGSARIRPLVVVPLVIAVAALMAAVFSVSLLQALTVSLAGGMIMLSVVVLTGYAGQLSLAQYAFAGIGAFVTGRLVATTGVPFEVAILAGIAAAVVAGVVLGLPAVRTRGVNLAVVTLALGYAVYSILFNNVAWTGGLSGTPVANQTFFGLNVDPTSYPARYCLLTFGFFLVCALMVSNVRRGGIGRRLLAVRSNERAAAALGVGVIPAKLYAFSLAAAIAAIGGIFLAFESENIIFSNYFDPVSSILIVAFAVVGGVGYVSGSLFGSVLIAGGLGAYVGQLVLPGLADYLQLIGGLSLIVLLLQAPGGLSKMNRDMAVRGIRLLRPKRALVTDRVTRALPSLAGPRERVRPRTLRADGLTIRFGGVTALEGLSMAIGPGEVVGLIGPNGAGKTTAIDAMTGFVSPAAGAVTLDDEPMNGWPVARRARAGVSRTFQSLELFEDSTVLENLRVASDERDNQAYITTLATPTNSPLPAVLVDAVRTFGLEGELDKQPSELPYGRRRLVAVARAVAVQPSVLLLDEPAAGLDAIQTLELADLIRVLADEWGIGILLVEHDVPFVMQVCDRITVLDFGRQIATGTPAEIVKDPAVIAAYLGEPEAEANEIEGEPDGVDAARS